jgi:hypothetical protein
MSYVRLIALSEFSSSSTAGHEYIWVMKKIGKVGDVKTRSKMGTHEWNQQLAAIQSNSSLNSAPMIYPFSSVYPTHQPLVLVYLHKTGQKWTYVRNDVWEDDQ